MIPVGVAYGTDVNKVREMLRNAISLLMERKPDGCETFCLTKVYRLLSRILVITAST